MSRLFQNILVTGGAGFIGSNFIRYIFRQESFKGRIINLDKLTYAGFAGSLDDIVSSEISDRYVLEIGDICDSENVSRILKQYTVDCIVHFAAESHVDRSIEGPSVFIQTNILGTFNLLEEARQYWGNRQDVLFHHVSTDEVYGSLGEDGYFMETTAYDPRSPYSASKASSDHLVRSYHHTYGLPYTLSNCSNNYGPYQFPEKLIPLMIENMLEGKPLPVYGDGSNIRDWLYVEDHNAAVWAVITRGGIGSSYNIGGENEWKNIRLVKEICRIMGKLTQKDEEYYLGLITLVKDRPGHDRRYAIDCSVIKKELGWFQSLDFEQGLLETVKWYLENRDWVNIIKSGEYRTWMEKNYQKRSVT